MFNYQNVPIHEFLHVIWLDCLVNKNENVKNDEESKSKLVSGERSGNRLTKRGGLKKGGRGRGDMDGRGD